MSMRAKVEGGGYGILPGVLGEAEMARYLAALERRLASCAHALRRGDELYAIRDLLAAVPETRALLVPEVVSIVRDVLGPDAVLVRATLFDKPPRANWSVPWHQDVVVALRVRIEATGFDAWTTKAGLLHARAPESVLRNMLTVRLHLDPCTEASGPLRVVGGSHLLGRMPSDAISSVAGTGVVNECLVPTGGVLVMRPLLIHSSRETHGEARRRVVHLEFAASTALPEPAEWAMAEPLT